LLPNRAVVGLGRLIDALPLFVELPSMIGTADTAILDHSVRQRRAAVRATLGDQAECAIFRAEQRQALAQDFYRNNWQLGILLGLGRGRARMPEAPHIFSHRRTRPDAG